MKKPWTRRGWLPAIVAAAGIAAALLLPDRWSPALLALPVGAAAWYASRAVRERAAGRPWRDFAGVALGMLAIGCWSNSATALLGLADVVLDLAGLLAAVAALLLVQSGRASRATPAG